MDVCTTGSFDRSQTGDGNRGDHWGKRVSCVSPTAGLAPRGCGDAGGRDRDSNDRAQGMQVNSGSIQLPLVS